MSCCLLGETARLVIWMPDQEPYQADVYAQNARPVTAELSRIDAWIQSQILTIPAGQCQLITTHDALAYFADASWT